MDKWESQLHIIFSRVLVLKVRLEIRQSSYRIIWPNHGGSLDKRQMEQTETTDKPQEVAFPCLPGIETRTPLYEPIVVRPAMVETVDCRKADEVGLRKAMVYARDIT